MQAPKLTGRVAWFDSRRGHGFIRRDDGERDAFVHRSQVIGENGRLRVGDLVEFHLALVGSRPQAVGVTITGNITERLVG